MAPEFTVIRDTTPAAAIPRGMVVAMGNFDGVHLGHRAVINAALQMGRAHGQPALAVTFEPHPRSFFSPNTPQFRLTDEAGKLRLLAGAGLDGAVVNLAKSGPSDEWGRWNFSYIVNRSLMYTTPALHVRNGRINFKFGDQKTVFYLLDTDLDISPPSSPGRGWLLDCTAKAARTDRPAQGPARSPCADAGTLHPNGST